MGMDLPKTIEEDDEVPNYSESSEEETDVQPEKKKRRQENSATSKDFDTGFEFFGGSGQNDDNYLNDQWRDLTKYLKKKKPKPSLDERIERIRREKQKTKQATEEED